MVEANDNNDAEQEEKNAAERTSPSTLAVTSIPSVLDDDTASVESEEELTVDDIDLDTSRLNKIDLHAVFSLPPHLQKDMVQKILRDRRQEVRDKFIPLAGQPEAYSHVQISSFLATVKLNRRIEAARREKTQEDLQAEEGAATSSSSANGSGHIIGHGKRIASNSNKFFIYEKATDKKNDGRLQMGAGIGRRSQTIEDGVDDSDNESSSEHELMADIDETAEAEASAAGVETYGLSLDDRFMPNKRRRQMPQGPEPGKMSLSDFSIKDFAAQAEQQLHQQQELQWDVDGARSAWLARHHLQAKHQPELAIEKARRARLGLASRTGADDSVAQLQHAESIAGAKVGNGSNTSESKPHAPTKRDAVVVIASGSGEDDKAAVEASPIAKLQPVGATRANEQHPGNGNEEEEQNLIAEIDADGDDDDDIGKS